MFYNLRRRIWHLWPKLNVEFVYTHDLVVIPVKNCRIQVSVFKLSLENVSRISEIKKMHLDKLRQRLERGDHCYVTEFENKLISYHWVQYSGYHFIEQAGRTIKVKPGDFWIYHVWVSERFRNNGVNSMVYSYLLNEAKKNEYRRALIYTNKNNIPNRKGLERLGFDLTNIIYSFKINAKYYQIYKRNLK